MYESAQILGLIPCATAHLKDCNAAHDWRQSRSKCWKYMPAQLTNYSYTSDVRPGLALALKRLAHPVSHALRVIAGATYCPMHRYGPDLSVKAC